MLVAHCAPTLAGMKTGSLFACMCGCAGELKQETEQWNAMFNPRGVFIFVLRISCGRALIYVYRKERLEKELEDEKRREFLTKLGYDCGDVSRMLRRLSERISGEEEFPHEIGLFLGYPFADVKGFIENKGKNCKCAGHWKVYTDEEEAKILFTKYRKCTDIYCRLLKEGSHILRLTVAGRCLRETGL